MGIQLIIVAALFVAASNFFMRKSIDSGGSSKAFLMIQLFIVFLIAVLLNPVRTGNYEWSTPMALFGLIGGIILAGMMSALGRALEVGPPGLTFAALNSSTVMPMVLMVMLFGAGFGYVYTFWNGVGSLLVVAGLFWAGWETVRSQETGRWVIFVTAAFVLHVVFLIFMQWRALFINFPGTDGLLLSFDMNDAKSQWFMPMVFLAASFVQTFVYVVNEKRMPLSQEITYGIMGGICNGIGTFFMIWSTEVSTSFEHAMIFPIFAVTIILLCNTWGQLIYKEKVLWRANAFCVIGLLVGTLDWKVLFGS